MLSISVERTLRIRRVGRALSDCLTVGAVNRSAFRVFVEVVENVAHCIGGTLNQSQWQQVEQEGSAGGTGGEQVIAGQEVNGASLGPGHLSKVNKRVDNWTGRGSLS